MTITKYTETDDFHNFEFSSGATCSVGKQSESNPNGAANYDEAYAILLMNIPDLEL